ncbi:hypothetical protein [Streptomyces hygroscopicus]|uniref:hypothetical protein n=1 Tax=Streptomyces hygroscopicus TaxID=1912 RepID=UPI0033EE73F8
MSSNAIIESLDSAQTDGLVCAICGADYLRVQVPHIPVGRSTTGPQVFACVGCAAEARDERGTR